MKKGGLTGLASIMLMAAGLMAADKQENMKDYRIVPIPKREHGYSNFDSMTINTQKEYDEFLKKHAHAESHGWNCLAEFKQALKNAEIDFDEEVLVLIRNTQGSGANQVTFDNGELKEGTLKFKVTVKTPGAGMMGTCDMAYYCAALAVKKAAVSKVEVFVNKNKAATLSVNQDF